jgi:preprotein translocase SecE subunit
MARNRQRSKQRQAERRARRLQQQGAETSRRDDAGSIPGVTPAPVEPTDPPPGFDPELLVGAPPEEEGRSDFVLEQEQDELEAEEHLAQDEAPASEEEALEEIEDWEVADQLDDPDAAGETGYAVRGRRGRAAHEAHKDRPRVIQFLIAVWAELQRVQWPNRQALVTLTGVVLGFVLIAGGYLGLLDAIFSELIKQIL